MKFVAEALWFFLPALVANQFPGFSAKLNLPGHFPITQRWLGENKTWDAYYAGIIGSVLIIYIQREFRELNLFFGLFDYSRTDLWIIGFLMGFGVIGGDHLKSFFKRRLNILPGARWWPFDQLDFVFGSLVATLPFVGWIGWERISAIVGIILILHPLGNAFSYWIGLRKVPW
jgi:CDP-diglyceride synthetase